MPAPLRRHCARHALTLCARSLADTYGERGNVAAATIQKAWRERVLVQRAAKWQALIDELRDAEADVDEVGEVEGGDAVAELPEDGLDDLDTHAPVVSTFPWARSSRIPQMALGRKSVPSMKLPAGQPLQRRRRTRAQTFAPDREGDYISPSDQTKIVLRSRLGERVAYPAVIRSWLDATARAEAVAAADAPRVRTTPATLHPLLTTNVASIGVGEGVVLYFSWLKNLARLFFVMAALATPACVFNVMAQRRFEVFSDRQDLFAQITLGTQQVSNAVEVASAGGNAVINTADTLYYGYRKETLLLVSSLLDVSYVVIFLITVLVMRITQGRMNKRERAENVTIGRFSVLVSRMPRTPATVGLASSIRHHFEQAYGPGSVAEVALATACATELRLFRARNAALVSRRNAAALTNATRGRRGTAETAAAALKVRMADAAIEREYSYSSVPTCVAAFVTFETAPMRDRCVAEHSSLRALIFPPKRLLYKGMRPLTVTPAPEPSNINWTHLEFGRVNRMFRRGITNCLAVSLMIGTAAIIVRARVKDVAARLVC